MLELVCHAVWTIEHFSLTSLEIAYEVLRTLRTSTVAAVVEKLTPLLHMDPVQKLPAEITAIVFGFLDAPTLLTASLASKAWRSRILDSQLWKTLYMDQGWGLNMEAMQDFEQSQIKQDGLSETQPGSRKAKSHLRSSDSDLKQPKLKKRAPASWLDQRQRSNPGLATQINDSLVRRPQNEIPEADVDFMKDDTSDDKMDEEMPDVPNTNLNAISPVSSGGVRLGPRPPSHGSNAMELHRGHRAKAPIDGDGNALHSELYPPIKPSLSIDLPSQARLNWPFIFKQRKRLEDNWLKGKFTTFQLPSPLHPGDGHRECVYAVQFFGKWLVSGSRDKTLRVWDLDRKRLRGSPLVGHTQSVLCLQFDPTEEEDVIISGSSDTNVIVWRFSTGEKIQEITQAHHESVLNLRFDHRYLVTCSKDKLIKVWNRREMTPLDPNYPKIRGATETKVPSYIIDTQSIPLHLLEAKIANRQVKTLAPYSLLMSLDGHGAAVNAVQIERDYIVSASGDRLIKVWQVSDGKLLQTVPGHNKGIACVQFDGKRIVSGSSDNTVRIFDKSSGAEVACLQGHGNLVRTVQAGFGDLPGSAAMYKSQAQAIDQEYFKAELDGQLDDEDWQMARRKKRRNAGSKNPKDIMAIGADLPPGGGGSQWGRIVSGSYDETIIIWRKDQDGLWVPGVKLHQSDAAQRAFTADHRAATLHASLGAARSNPQNPRVTPQHHNHAMPPSQPATPSAQQIVHQAIQTANTSMAAGFQNLMSVNSALQSQGNVSSSNHASSSTAPHGRTLSPGAQQALHQLQSLNDMMQHRERQHQQQHQAHSQASSSFQPSQNHNPSAVPLNPQPQSTQPLSPQPGPASQQQQPQQQAQQPHHHHHHHHHHTHGGNQGPHHAPHGIHVPHPYRELQPASRVFKLQFDARRIICCSQDPRIVGWDFAADDEEIMEASKFFAGL